MEIKNKNLYYVGGVVRDEILGTTSFDTDYCYEGNAIEFAKDFNIIRTNPAFGTVRISCDGEEIDIASTRTERYPKAGHLPAIERIGCSLKDDLKRRDFTINALAKNTLTGEIIDYFGGLSDIKEKKLRVLHDNSFIDDPSRIIRALKFSVRFDFELDKHTLELQNNYLKNINYDVSYHRLKKELKETFNLNVYKAYEEFVSQNLYKLLNKNETAQNLDSKIENLINTYQPINKWIIYLGQYDLSAFELTAQEEDIVSNYKRIKAKKVTNPLDIYYLFDKIPLESILLYACTVDYDTAIIYLENLSQITIDINGEDLIKIGIPQGKIYKEIFAYITQKKINNPKISKDEQIALIQERFL